MRALPCHTSDTISEATMAQPSYTNPARSKRFQVYGLGHLELPNRIMAPLIRNRAALGNVPTALSARYYAQRASAGLINSEATRVALEGQGCEATPGIHSPAQIEGLRDVTRAVHASGGRIFLQLWQVGWRSPLASYALALFTYLIQGIGALAPVYIHVVEGATGGERNFGEPFDYGLLHRNFRGTYIASNGYDFATATDAIASGRCGSRLVRQGVPRQSRSGGPLSCKRSAQRPQQVDVLWRRCKRLYRLPIFGGGVLVHERPACALCHSDVRCLQFCMN
jgi:2,4-dienoyl-CoA reductase-like NADH-dependent reductase (Old Yellow Enzyme family)